MDHLHGSRDVQPVLCRKRFVLDLIGNLPIEVFSLAAGWKVTDPVFSAWRIPRLLRFFRIKKIHKPTIVT